jgi:hypothetical protein
VAMRQSTTNKTARFSALPRERVRVLLHCRCGLLGDFEGVRQGAGRTLIVGTELAKTNGLWLGVWFDTVVTGGTMVQIALEVCV